MLDELLETEDVLKHGPVWNKDQHSEMSLQDLVQSGVIGLDDEISSSLPVSPRSQLPSSDSDTETSEICENCSGSRGSVTESFTCVDVQQKVDRSDILQDLQVLEEQILEERFKLEALRLSESEPLARSHVTTRSSCRERRMFLAHLEDERWVVEKMERSLRKERVKKRVVRCSIMKNSMKKDLWSSDTEEKLQHTDTSHLTKMNTSPSPQDEKQECTEVANKSQSSLSSPASPDSTSLSEIDQDVRSRHEESDTSDLSRFSSTDSPASVHPERSSNPLMDEISSCPAETQQTNPENGAFDPGGALVPAPKRVFYDAQTQKHSESISESINLTQTPGEITRCLRGLHMQNNNNNTLVQSYRHDGHSETQENISTVIANTAEPQHEESVKAEWEETGQMSGRERNERGVYDGGGSTRAVFGSLLDQPQLITSNRPLDYKTPIVLDTGSGLMKAGFADQDLPTIVFPTVIGHPKYEEVMSGGVDRDVYVGHDARHMRGVLTLKHPIRNGIVRNWDEMEMIWHHAFQQLSVDPRDHPVMLTEAAMNPLENRQRMIELMFETFNVPLTFVAMQAVLALYASGRTTGVVLDSGDGVSHSVPVFDGYCLPHAVQRFSLAGADVTLQLQKLLLEQGVCMQTSAELEIVREMKEKCCCVALDYESEIRKRGHQRSCSSQS
ncbi:uncharacterized protein si:ch211-241j12.3 isoform X2 [Triplophysa rosa]|uniref:uncharacterized protein si:ch211-241j12.3 isoform X2 n=1 Tax=Triplophysa rosa TaxID=992332 RepID=UPI00254636E3|nr:uncharacterized protein si:ch211-241j12.3 isoform X2 [Triplophysa rosa]